MCQFNDNIKFIFGTMGYFVGIMLAKDPNENKCEAILRF